MGRNWRVPGDGSSIAPRICLGDVPSKCRDPYKCTLGARACQWGQRGARLPQDITAEAEGEWLVRSHRMAAKLPRIPGLHGDVRVCCWLHRSGGRRWEPWITSASIRDSGGAWFNVSSATLADTRKGLRAVVEMIWLRTAACARPCMPSRHGHPILQLLLDMWTRRSMGHFEDSALSRCFDRRSMSRVEMYDRL
ncbi:hypothetical protein VTI74DRAFT_5476 [Chaetomium olivicolor]